MLISGQCQCGNISFVLNWSPEPTEIPARACSCSFCTAHSGVWTSSPLAKLVVQIDDSASVTRHTFATGTAEFHICTKCGDVPLVTSQIDDCLYAVVNVNALQGVPAALLKHETASFDGEGVEQRLDRRRQRWISDVTMHTSR